MQVRSFVGRKQSVKRMITTLPLYINITRLGYFAVLELIQIMHESTSNPEMKTTQCIPNENSIRGLMMHIYRQLLQFPKSELFR